jgi:hypothetical protein
LFAGQGQQGQQQQMYSRGGSARGAPRGNGAPRGRGGQNRREPLKFDGDYDFEEANAQFHKDEIEKEFKKLNISELKIYYFFFNITAHLYFYCKYLNSRGVLSLRFQH